MCIEHISTTQQIVTGLMIAFQCPHCFIDLKAKDEFAGKKIKCRACGEVVLVEADGGGTDDD
jgi:hypothetical protein